MLTWAHRVHNPNGISIGSAMFAQITAECRRACPRACPFPQNLPLVHGPTRIHTQNAISTASAVFAGPPNMDGSIVFVGWRQCAPHVRDASLGPRDSKTQTASRSVQPFLYSSRQSVAILNTLPLFPVKIDPSHGRSETSSNTLAHSILN